MRSRKDAQITVLGAIVGGLDHAPTTTPNGGSRVDGAQGV